MKKVFWFVLAVTLSAVACNTSKITTSWRADLLPPQQYDKILVLGMINDNDRTIRENMENHFVGDLNNMGYHALSALKEYGPKAFDKMSEDSAINILKNTGVDAIITIVMLDKKKERKYVNDPMKYYPLGYYNTGFWEYQSTLSQRIQSPGYYVMDTKYYWETNFYDVTSKKLLYSAQTKSFDPENTQTLGHQYSLMLVNNMLKQKVLTAKATPAAD